MGRHERAANRYLPTVLNPFYFFFLFPLRLADLAVAFLFLVVFLGDEKILSQLCENLTDDPVFTVYPVMDGTSSVGEHAYEMT